MAESGINIDPNNWSSLTKLCDQIEDSGVQWVRMVLRPDRDYVSLMKSLKLGGVKILGVLDGDSLGQPEVGWRNRVRELKAKYGFLVDAWQPFNEPDADPLSTHSWPMSAAQVQRGIRMVREELGPDAYIVGPGLSNSRPWYLDNIDWREVGCNAIGCQGLYGRYPVDAYSDIPALRFGSYEELIQRYSQRAKDLGLDLWVTEWGFIDHELGGLFANVISASTAWLGIDARIKVAMQFQLGPMPGFGLINPDYTPTSAYEFFTTWITKKEETPMPVEVHSIEDWIAAHPTDKLGMPVTTWSLTSVPEYDELSNKFDTVRYARLSNDVTLTEAFSPVSGAREVWANGPFA